jgi:hypothetical protein
MGVSIDALNLAQCGQLQAKSPVPTGRQCSGQPAARQ